MRRYNLEQATEVMKDLEKLLSKPYRFTPKIIRAMQALGMEMNEANKAITMLNHAYFEKDEIGNYVIYKYLGDKLAIATPDEHGNINLSEEEKDAGWKFCNKIPDELLADYVKHKAELSEVDVIFETLNDSLFGVDVEHIAIILKHKLNGDNS